jgi:hypothetical protein
MELNTWRLNTGEFCEGGLKYLMTGRDGLEYLKARGG